MKPKKGLITFNAEGNNNPASRYYSRVIHWPGSNFNCQNHLSGVTLGRGYDMRYRSKHEIIHDLTLAGIPYNKAKQISAAAGKFSCTAAQFVRDYRANIEEITELQQLRLFENVYNRYIIDANRFYNRYRKPGSIAWERLHPALQEVLIDMKYQGTLRQHMIPIFGLNNLKAIIDMIVKDPVIRGYATSRTLTDYLKGQP